VDWNVSDDAVGLLLLVLTALLVGISWYLADRGLNAAEKAAREAAEAAEASKQAAARLAADPSVAGAGVEARAELAEAATSFTSASSQLTTALEELKGVFAPTRAFLAFAALTFIASLIAFDVISLDLTADPGGTTTTETTPSP
jgi:hypothetical protein